MLVVFFEELKTKVDRMIHFFSYLVINTKNKGGGNELYYTLTDQYRRVSFLIFSPLIVFPVAM